MNLLLKHLRLAGGDVSSLISELQISDNSPASSVTDGGGSIKDSCTGCSGDCGGSLDGASSDGDDGGCLGGLGVLLTNLSMMNDNTLRFTPIFIHKSVTSHMTKVSKTSWAPWPLSFAHLVANFVFVRKWKIPYFVVYLSAFQFRFVILLYIYIF